MTIENPDLLISRVVSGEAEAGEVEKLLDAGRTDPQTRRRLAAATAVLRLLPTANGGGGCDGLPDKVMARLRREAEGAAVGSY